MPDTIIERGYLESDYLTDDYLLAGRDHHISMQVNLLKTNKLGMQARLVTYNTTELRLMYDFPSRGDGTNWTSTSTAAGDFSPNNINTDIVEQIFRSGAASSASVTITCDTGVAQGVLIDTIAILGHNFTSSARVQVQGSNDNFATTRVVFDMSTELVNMYYIAPNFPSNLGQNRYWRFIIQDATNAAGYIEIGTLLFGLSNIFTVREAFDNPLKRGLRHFKDEIPTEGFTNVSNNRALKKWLRLNFSSLDYVKGNFRKLENMFEFARTSLKVLVIPTPSFPSRFAIYGKLVEMPDPEHNSIGQNDEYISLSLEFDESR